MEEEKTANVGQEKCENQDWGGGLTPNSVDFEWKPTTQSTSPQYVNFLSFKFSQGCFGTTSRSGRDRKKKTKKKQPCLCTLFSFF